MCCVIWFLVGLDPMTLWSLTPKL